MINMGLYLEKKVNPSILKDDFFSRTDQCY